MSYKAIVERYRPKILNNYIGQDRIVNIIRGMAKNKKWALTYLLHGSWGCGKTTLARILALYINCSNPEDNGDPCFKCTSCRNPTKNINELNGSDKRKIDDIRSLIRLSTLRSIYKHKVIIIDEAHQLTPQAQEALLKPLEDNVNKVIWILCTTDPQKLKPTIKSRCTSFQIKTVPIDVLASHMNKIAKKEGFPIKEESLENIALKTEGHVRDSLNILDQLIKSLQNNPEENINIDDLILNIINTSVMIPPASLAKKLLASLYKATGKYSESLMLVSLINNPKFITEELIKFNDEMINWCASNKLIDIYKKDWHSTINQIFINLQNDKFSKKDMLNIGIGIHKILLTLYPKLNSWETDKYYMKVPILEAIEFTYNLKKAKEQV